MRPWIAGVFVGGSSSYSQRPQGYPQGALPSLLVPTGDGQFHPPGGQTLFLLAGQEFPPTMPPRVFIIIAAEGQCKKILTRRKTEKEKTDSRH
ncbi:hypothetical protein BU251_09565 [Candidatus Velamenicoccus archaeovorus]|uniref:Uncharacterized protein n=1 Tax=Velamenicoccus archaeovorus TaxID=1930593 RepID=A0A410P7G4_VELA1|nr:hypothetical protein BU251_09565 [Candidatus Velamenicoccus archaeovorus]